MFHGVVAELCKPSKGKSKSTWAPRGNEVMQKILSDTEKLLNNGKSIATQHPKLDMVKRLVSSFGGWRPLWSPHHCSGTQLVNHLAQHQEDGQQTRCMVFCSFREAVNELVVRLIGRGEVALS